MNKYISCTQFGNVINKGHDLLSIKTLTGQEKKMNTKLTAILFVTAIITACDTQTVKVDDASVSPDSSVTLSDSAAVVVDSSVVDSGDSSVVVVDASDASADAKK